MREDTPAKVTFIQPATLYEVPDSPFPIEAAIEARAKAEGRDRTVPAAPANADIDEPLSREHEQPTLNIVPSSTDDLPPFLVRQLKHRHVVGDHSQGHEGPGERSVA